MLDRPIVVFDTETTGRSGALHLVELGAVRVVDGDIADQFESLVCPLVPIEDEAMLVHGIEDAHVMQAPGAREVLEEFFAWLGDDWLAAHRAEVDAAVLATECSRHGLAAPGQPVVDTLALARKVLPEAPDHKLGTLIEFLELEDGPRHRALPDAVWCWKVVEACVERLIAEARAGDQALERQAGSTSRSDELPLTRLLSARGAPVTIPSSSPHPPRGLKPRHRKIVTAIERGASVTLVYGDPESEPVPLRVAPKLLFGRGSRAYLEAECVHSGLLKTYRLDRVHKVVS